MNKRPRDSETPLPYKRHQTMPQGTLGGDTLTYNLAVERTAREIVAEERRYILQQLLTIRQLCAEALSRCVPPTHVGR